MNIKRIRIARIKIDRIDKKILYLIKKRTQIVKYMLSLKKFKREIVDHKRNNAILKKIRNRSIKNGVDPQITKRIWKAMILSYVDFQRKNFKKK